MDGRDRLSISSLRAILFLVLAEFAASATISADVFDSHGGSTGRSLLQAKKSCPINFEFMNYAIITSQCKGPQYLPKLCCGAFKQFACPYADQINDGTNDCASTMFSYINLYGKYPPGLFASECREGKEGLACPADTPQSAESSSANAAVGHLAQKRLSLLLVVLVAGLLMPAIL